MNSLQVALSGPHNAPKPTSLNAIQMAFVNRIGNCSRTCILTSILGIGFCSTAKAQFSIAAASTNYTQNFNSLTSGTWTDNTTLTGWYAKTDATASITTYGAGTGTTTTAGLYAYGVAGTNPLSDRALGFYITNTFAGAAGTGKAYTGWRLINNTGAAITSLTITWSGEQWRRDNASTQNLVLEYQTGATVTNLTAGTWTAASSTFTSPQTGAALGLDGNTAANRTAGISVTITFGTAVPNGQEIMLRWADLNDSGNDHSLAIDDVTINAATSAGPCTPPTTQASSLTSTSVSCSSVTLNWTRGNGNAMLITGIGGASATGDPSNGVTYTGNSVFTAGSGVGGGYAVYNGTGTSVTITGLAGNTQYTFAVYEYASTGTCYLTPPVSVTFTTASCGGSQCAYITSVLVNSCDGTCSEGDNEIIFINTGSSSLTATPANIQTYYGSSAPPATNYSESFATNAGTISAMNTAAGCATLFVDASSGISIPANSPVMLVRSSMCQNSYDWSSLCGQGPIYVLFSTDASWAVGGNFVNGGGTRYFRTTYDGCVTDYSYDSDVLPGGNGAYIVYGTSGGAPAGYFNTGCALSVIVLPVTIHDFIAKKTGQAVQLSWTATEEADILYYGVEKSLDGISWSSAGIINAASSGIAGHVYTVTDDELYKGISYYRLYSVSRRGDKKYHQTISYDLNEQMSSPYTIAYTGEGAVVKIRDLSAGATLHLYNLSGRPMYTVSLDPGSNEAVEISENTLEKGMYLVKIRSGNKTYNDKIIIQ